MKMKLISRRIRSMEELVALEDKFGPAVCGPSPLTFAARHGLKLSKSYVTFMRSQKSNGNGARKAVQPRRKLVSTPRRTGNRSLFLFAWRPCLEICFDTSPSIPLPVRGGEGGKILRSLRSFAAISFRVVRVFRGSTPIAGTETGGTRCPTLKFEISLGFADGYFLRHVCHFERGRFCCD